MPHDAARSGHLAAILDWIVWGAGHLYLGRKSGVGWLIAYGFAHAPVVVLGLSFYDTETAGLLILIAHLTISTTLACEADQAAPGRRTMAATGTREGASTR